MGYAVSDADFRLALARLRAARTHLVTACEMVPTSDSMRGWRSFVLADMANIERLMEAMRTEANNIAASGARARRKAKR